MPRREDTWWKSHEDDTVGEYDVRARRDGILHIISDSYGSLSLSQADTIADAMNELEWRCHSCKRIMRIEDIPVDDEMKEYCVHCNRELPPEPIGSYYHETEEQLPSDDPPREKEVALPVTPRKGFHDEIEEDYPS